MNLSIRCIIDIVIIIFYILQINIKWSSNNTSLFRYRLVPYGNHSYLESLTDKSKVRNAVLSNLALPSLFKHFSRLQSCLFCLSCVCPGASSVLLWWPEVLLGQQIRPRHGGLSGLCPAVQRGGGKRRHWLLPSIQVRYLQSSTMWIFGLMLISQGIIAVI